ncbi:F-box family protein [Dorcoceras hygrometricum]|uniref:F-box family protein n=1 Tax=Dorcoceras hygrometricum TaxID=472368 RepID=A0A2Z7CPW7_9LAMI|nr:F-box family protein [Dorcoceras hygrometricum]
MSLFNLQDVCIVIGSLATLDLPMVLDLIGIYVLKGPYCGLKNCFHIIIISFGNCVDRSDRIGYRDYDVATPPHPLLHTLPPPTAPSAAAVARFSRGRTCFDHVDEEIPFVPNSSYLLVQADEGFMFPVVDLIKEDLPPPTLKSQIPCEFGWSQAPRRQQGDTL